MKKYLEIIHLENYKTYRVVNYDIEDYFKTKKELVKACSRVKDNYKFYTYDEKLVKYFKKNELTLELEETK